MLLRLSNHFQISEATSNPKRQTLNFLPVALPYVL
jgi:hypothetical protein